MIRAIIASAFAVALAGCTADQLTTVQSYQDKIASVCKGALMLAPFAPAIEPWVVGGCASEAAIAKLALDPTSLAWLDGLIVKARGKA